MVTNKLKSLVFLGLITLAVSKSHNKRFARATAQHEFESQRTSLPSPSAIFSQISARKHNLATQIANEKSPTLTDRHSDVASVHSFLTFGESNEAKTLQLRRRVLDMDNVEEEIFKSRVDDSADADSIRKHSQESDYYEDSQIGTSSSEILPEDLYFEPMRVRSSASGFNPSRISQRTTWHERYLPIGYRQQNVQARNQEVSDVSVNQSDEDKAVEVTTSKSVKPEETSKESFKDSNDAPIPKKFMEEGVKILTSDDNNKERLGLDKNQVTSGVEYKNTSNAFGHQGGVSSSIIDAIQAIRNLAALKPDKKPNYKSIWKTLQNATIPEAGNDKNVWKLLQNSALLNPKQKQVSGNAWNTQEVTIPNSEEENQKQDGGEKVWKIPESPSTVKPGSKTNGAFWKNKKQVPSFKSNNGSTNENIWKVLTTAKPKEHNDQDSTFKKPDHFRDSQNYSLPRNLTNTNGKVSGSFVSSFFRRVGDNLFENYDISDVTPSQADWRSMYETKDGSENGDYYFSSFNYMGNKNDQVNISHVPVSGTEFTDNENTKDTYERHEKYKQNGEGNYTPQKFISTISLENPDSWESPISNIKDMQYNKPIKPTLNFNKWESPISNIKDLEYNKPIEPTLNSNSDGGKNNNFFSHTFLKQGGQAEKPLLEVHDDKIPSEKIFPDEKFLPKVPLPETNKDATETNEKEKYFMHIYKRMGNLAGKDKIVPNNEKKNTEGFVESVRTRWSGNSSDAFLTSQVNGRIKASDKMAPAASDIDTSGDYSDESIDEEKIPIGESSMKIDYFHRMRRSVIDSVQKSAKPRTMESLKNLTDAIEAESLSKGRIRKVDKVVKSVNIKRIRVRNTGIVSKDEKQVKKESKPENKLSNHTVDNKNISFNTRFKNFRASTTTAAPLGQNTEVTGKDVKINNEWVKSTVKKSPGRVSFFYHKPQNVSKRVGDFKNSSVRPESKNADSFYLFNKYENPPRERSGRELFQSYESPKRQSVQVAEIQFTTGNQKQIQKPVKKTYSRMDFKRLDSSSTAESTVSSHTAIKDKQTQDGMIAVAPSSTSISKSYERKNNFRNVSQNGTVPVKIPTLRNPAIKSKTMIQSTTRPKLDKQQGVVMNLSDRYVATGVKGNKQFYHRKGSPSLSFSESFSFSDGSNENSKSDQSSGDGTKPWMLFENGELSHKPENDLEKTIVTHLVKHSKDIDKTKWKKSYKPSEPVRSKKYEEPDEYSFKNKHWGNDIVDVKPKGHFPTYGAVPLTSFKCSKGNPGYYADPETSCQVFHMCQVTGEKHSFLCPNSTLFNQELLVCDWYSNVKCHAAMNEEQPFDDHQNHKEYKQSNDIHDNEDERGKNPSWKWTSKSPNNNHHDVTYKVYSITRENADRDGDLEFSTGNEELHPEYESQSVSGDDYSLVNKEEFGKSHFEPSKEYFGDFDQNSYDPNLKESDENKKGVDYSKDYEHDVNPSKTKQDENQRYFPINYSNREQNGDKKLQSDWNHKENQYSLSNLNENPKVAKVEFYDGGNQKAGLSNAQTSEQDDSGNKPLTMQGYEYTIKLGNDRGKKISDVPQISGKVEAKPETKYGFKFDTLKPNENVETDIETKPVTNHGYEYAVKLGHDRSKEQGSDVELNKKLGIKGGSKPLTSSYNFNRPQLSEKLVTNSKTKPLTGSYNFNRPQLSEKFEINGWTKPLSHGYEYSIKLGSGDKAKQEVPDVPTVKHFENQKYPEEHSVPEIPLVDSNNDRNFRGKQAKIQTQNYGEKHRPENHKFASTYFTKLNREKVEDEPPHFQKHETVTDNLSDDFGYSKTLEPFLNNKYDDINKSIFILKDKDDKTLTRYISPLPGISDRKHVKYDNSKEDAKKLYFNSQKKQEYEEPEKKTEHDVQLSKLKTKIDGIKSDLEKIANTASSLLQKQNKRNGRNYRTVTENPRDENSQIEVYPLGYLEEKNPSNANEHLVDDETKLKLPQKDFYEYTVNDDKGNHETIRDNPDVGDNMKANDSNLNQSIQIDKDDRYNRNNDPISKTNENKTEELNVKHDDGNNHHGKEIKRPISHMVKIGPLNVRNTESGNNPNKYRMNEHNNIHLPLFRPYNARHNYKKNTVMDIDVGLISDDRKRPPMLPPNVYRESINMNSGKISPEKRPYGQSVKIGPLASGVGESRSNGDVAGRYAPYTGSPQPSGPQRIIGVVRRPNGYIIPNGVPGNVVRTNVQTMNNFINPPNNENHLQSGRSSNGGGLIARHLPVSNGNQVSNMNIFPQNNNNNPYYNPMMQYRQNQFHNARPFGNGNTPPRNMEFEGPNAFYNRLRENYINGHNHSPNNVRSFKQQDHKEGPLEPVFDHDSKQRTLRPVGIQTNSQDTPVPSKNQNFNDVPEHGRNPNYVSRPIRHNYNIEKYNNPDMNHDNPAQEKPDGFPFNTEDIMKHLEFISLTESDESVSPESKSLKDKNKGNKVHSKINSKPAQNPRNGENPHRGDDYEPPTYKNPNYVSDRELKHSDRAKDIGDEVDTGTVIKDNSYGLGKKGPIDEIMDIEPNIQLSTQPEGKNPSDLIETDNLPCPHQNSGEEDQNSDKGSSYIVNDHDKHQGKSRGIPNKFNSIDTPINYETRPGSSDYPSLTNTNSKTAIRNHDSRYREFPRSRFESQRSHSTDSRPFEYPSKYKMNEPIYEDEHDYEKKGRSEVKDRGPAKYEPDSEERSRYAELERAAEMTAMKNIKSKSSKN